MIKGLTSIILTCYDQTQTARHTSMTAAAMITRYTNPKDYELIIVDCCPKYPFRDDYHVLKIDKMIPIPPPDIGYYPAMNLGAKVAKGEYLCFIENDVFVTPDWLENLKYYLQTNKLDAVLPHQIPNTYDQTKQFEMLSMDDGMGKGASEQGLILIKKESFDKMGGWDKKLTAGYGWKRFYQQMGENGIRYNNTAKCMITHITGMSYYNALEFEKDKFEKNTKIENTYLNGQD